MIHSRKTGTFLSPPVILPRELEHRVHYSVSISQTKGLASIDRLQPSPALLARPRVVRSCGSLSETSDTTHFPPQADPGRAFFYPMQQKSHNRPQADSRQSSKPAFFQDVIWLLYKKFKYHVNVDSRLQEQMFRAYFFSLLLMFCMIKGASKIKKHLCLLLLVSKKNTQLNTIMTQ